MLIKCSTSLVRSIRPKGCLLVVVSYLFRTAPSQNALFRTCALGNPSVDEQVYVDIASSWLPRRLKWELFTLAGN